MSKHNISHASELYYGGAYDPVLFGTQERTGAPMRPVSKISLGSPVALDADGMITGATSTELPNAGTITYTTADDGSSPIDNAATPAPSTIMTEDGSVSVWALDVPRNITATSTTAVADTVFTITGYDVYKQKMVEQFTIAAAGSAAAGKKAFAYIYSIAIYSAGDITTDTVTVGWGDVLGLPYAITAKSDVMQAWFNDVYETTAPTTVAGVTSTATATTGDVRGTIDLNSALDGSTVVAYVVTNPSSRSLLLGVDQYSG